MARRSALIAALLALVLLGHGVALDWLAAQAEAQAAMRLMAPPMFTRLLQPQNPPPVPVSEPKVAGVQVPRARSAIKSIAPSVPASTTATAAVPPTATETATAAGTPTEAVTQPAPSPFTLGPTPPQAAASAPLTVSPTVSASATASPTVTASTSAVSGSASLTTSGTDVGSWPGDTRLNYRLGGYYRGELHGNARVQWQREGSRYQTRVDIDLGVVSLVMTSQGEVSAQGLSPSAYEETRAGKRRSVKIEDKAVVLSDNTRVPRPDGVQDTASQFVELSHRFASGQLPLEVGRSVTFPMARPGGVDVWTYDIVAREVLQTPQLGAVEAYHLKPRPLANPRGNITAEMWFAPSLQYLPVRIRVTLGDAYVDMSVETIQQR